MICCLQLFVYILGNDIIEQNLQLEESYEFECDNDDFDVAVARRLERFVLIFVFQKMISRTFLLFTLVCLHFRLRRRSGQRSGDSYNSVDFKTAPQSLQSPHSFQ